MEMDGRIGACRMRLRRTRAMRRAVARNIALVEAPGYAPLTRSGDGEQSVSEAGTISVNAQSPVDWMEDGAMPEVDRRPSPRARFSTEEETVRA